MKEVNSTQKAELDKLTGRVTDLKEREQMLENNVKVTQKLYAEATQTANEYSMKLESALEERDDAVLNMESMQEQLEMLKQALDSMTALSS